MHSFKTFVKQFPQLASFLHHIYLQISFIYFSIWTWFVTACVRFLQRLVVLGDIDALRVTKKSIELTYYGGTFQWNPLDRNSLLGIGHTGTYESHELKILSRHIKPRMTVVDVGANYGLYSVYCAQLVGPLGHVYSFEPLRKSFNELIKNIRINAVEDRITAEQIGLSNTQGKVKLFVSSALGSGATSMRERWAGASFTETAILTTLDRYVSTYKIPRIDVIKCDVEGAELLVFSGAREVLGRWHPVLLFEAIENHTKLFTYEVSDLLDFIASYAYTLYRIVDGRLEQVIGAAQNGNYLALPQRKTHEKKH